MGGVVMERMHSVLWDGTSVSTLVKQGQNCLLQSAWLVTGTDGVRILCFRLLLKFQPSYHTAKEIKQKQKSRSWTTLALEDRLAQGPREELLGKKASVLTGRQKAMARSLKEELLMNWDRFFFFETPRF